MTVKLIGHITDTHLGQKLAPGGSVKSGRIGYEADPEEHKDNLKRILAELRKRSVNDIIFGGDIGTSATHKWFFGLIRAHGFNLRLVLGNHDSLRQVCLNYQRPVPGELAELTYTEQDAFAKYIYMDSSSNKIGATQLSWLKRELMTDKKVLLFVHHPVIKIDTPLDAAGAALEGREKIADALRSSQNKIIVFCGHYHMDDETVDGNVRQYSTPAASYLIEKTAKSIAIDKHTFGYRLIRIEGEKISTGSVLLKKSFE
jgi:3',5'-cyclic AMP phosphodiesterase CpdA